MGSSAVISASAAQETSAGSVFVHGRSLHIQFHQLRVKPERPDAVNMPNRRLPDLTGLTYHALSFAFSSARRPASYVIRGNADATLVLDYEQIVGLRSIPSTPATPAVLQPTPGTNPTAPAGDREADKVYYFSLQGFPVAEVAREASRDNKVAGEVNKKREGEPCLA